MRVLQRYAEHITHIHDSPEGRMSEKSSLEKRLSSKSQSPTELKKIKKKSKDQKVLYIKIFKAKFTRDTELTGEMDPFVEIDYL